jgi:hypothetical protein
MQKIVALILIQSIEFIAEHELDRIEEVALSTSISSDDHIVLRRKISDSRDLSVASKAGDVDFTNIHFSQLNEK